VLIFRLGYGFIYRQIGRGQPKLDFPFLLNLGV